MDLVAGSPRIPAPGETVMGRDFCTFSGGKGANQAVAVAKVGWPVHLVGKVGRDSFGRDLRASLEQAGVNVSAVDVTEGESGVALIVTDDHGQNSIVVAPGANNLVSPENIQKNRDLISSAGFVLCQLEIPLESVLYLAQLCAGEGVPLMLDPAPARILPEELLSRVSWITPNESETRRLLGPDFTEDGKDDESVLAERILKLGPKNVVLKLGQNGCYVIASSPALQFRSRAYDVEGVDTTAAGDAFNGVFATALLQGLGLPDAIRFASAAAAISVTRRGAQPSMPTHLEVENFLQARRSEQILV
jgi:ribokinase